MGHFGGQVFGRGSKTRRMGCSRRGCKGANLRVGHRQRVAVASGEPAALHIVCSWRPWAMACHLRQLNTRSACTPRMPSRCAAPAAEQTFTDGSKPQGGSSRAALHTAVGMVASQTQLVKGLLAHRNMAAEGHCLHLQHKLVILDMKLPFPAQSYGESAHHAVRTGTRESAALGRPWKCWGPGLSVCEPPSRGAFGKRRAHTNRTS